MAEGPVTPPSVGAGGCWCRRSVPQPSPCSYQQIKRLRLAVRKQVNSRGAAHRSSQVGSQEWLTTAAVNGYSPSPRRSTVLLLSSGRTAMPLACS